MRRQFVLLDSSVLINVLATAREREVLSIFSGGAAIDPATLRAILGRVERVAQFRPPHDDPHRDWWTAA